MKALILFCSTLCCINLLRRSTLANFQTYTLGGFCRPYRPSTDADQIPTNSPQPAKIIYISALDTRHVFPSRLSPLPGNSIFLATAPETDEDMFTISRELQNAYSGMANVQYPRKNCPLYDP